MKQGAASHREAAKGVKQMKPVPSHILLLNKRLLLKWGMAVHLVQEHHGRHVLANNCTVSDSGLQADAGVGTIETQFNNSQAINLVMYYSEKIIVRCTLRAISTDINTEKQKSFLSTKFRIISTPSRMFSLQSKAHSSTRHAWIGLRPAQIVCSGEVKAFPQ